MKACFISLLVISTAAYGQNTIVLSMDKAVESGLQNSFTILQNEYALRSAENAFKQTKANSYPELSLQADSRYNVTLPTSILPKEFFNSAEDQKIKFGTRYSSAFSLTATQPLVDLSKRNDIKIADLRTQQAKLTFEYKKEVAILSIKEKYYEAMLLQKESALLAKIETRRRDQLLVSETRYLEGKIQRSERDKFNVNYLNAKTLRSNKAYEQVIALQNLASYIGISDSVSIVLSDTSLNRGIESEIDTVNNEYSINKIKLEQQRQRANISKERSAYLPVINLVGNYTYQYQANSLELSRSRAWSNFSYVGIQLKVPIVSRSRYFSLREAFLKEKLLRDSAIQVVRSARQNTSRAKSNIQIAQSNYEQSLATVDQATQAYQSVFARFKEGRVPYSELIDSEMTLLDSERTMMTSTVTLIKARLDYARATID